MSWNDDSSSLLGNDVDDLLDDLPGDMRGKLTINVQYLGNKTIIQNFSSILRNLGREESHVTKFISSKLGVQTTKQDSQLHINSKINKTRIEDVLEQYSDKFVICSECGKPDTAFNEDNELQCLACGNTQDLN